MPQIKVQDAEIYYEVNGKGYPLLLIGGYSCDTTLWNPVLEDLSHHFEVMVVDNRGAGQTKDRNAPLTIEGMAEDIHHIIKELQLKQPHIVGQSMGTMLAQVLAAEHPEQIGKLGLLVTTSNCRKAVLTAFQTHIELIEKKADFEIIFASLISWVFGEAFLQDQNKVNELRQEILHHPHPQTLENQKRQLDALKNYQGHAYLSKIRSETYIAVGKEDIICLPAEGLYVASQIKNSIVSSFQSGHGVIRERPQELAQQLISFLEKI